MLVVTHDPHTALMARRRIVLAGGAVTAVVERTAGEAARYEALGRAYREQRRYQTQLRKGAYLA